MGKKVPFWQFFRKADMALFNLCMKIKFLGGHWIIVKILCAFEFSHQFFLNDMLLRKIKQPNLTTGFLKQMYVNKIRS